MIVGEGDEEARQSAIVAKWKSKWPQQGDGGIAPIRSLHWKLCLSQLSSPSQRDGRVESRWVDEVRQERRRYAALRDSILRAPDGTFPSDLAPPIGEGEDKDTAPSRGKQQDLDVNNPLSLDDENPWNAYLESLTTLDQIRNDVHRTFPEDERFRGQDAQKLLTRVLFVWSAAKENSEVGYRQGMHELAAAIFITRFGERLKRDRGIDDDAELVLDEAYVEHDSYSLFAGFMQHAKAWYVWNRPADLTPIMERCQAIEAILATVDPLLAQHMQVIGMENAALCASLATSPLSPRGNLHLWDELLARSPNMRLVDEVCVAMLLRIRHELLAASDYSEALMVLLKYPRPNATALLARQASSLFYNASQVTMQACVKENHDLLGTPPFTPVIPSPEPRAATSSPPTSVTNPYGAISDIARGIYSQSSALGINRALQNAIQRGVEAAGALAAEDSRRTSSDGFPPSMHASRFAPREVKPERQLDALRTSNMAVATALTSCIDVLERHYLKGSAQGATSKEGQKGDEGEERERDQVEFLMSLTAIKHARDVLTGSAKEFDGAILTALKQQQQQQQQQQDHGEEAKEVQPKKQDRPLPNHRAFARLEDERGTKDGPTPAPKSLAIQPTKAVSADKPAPPAAAVRVSAQAPTPPPPQLPSPSPAPLAVSAMDDPLGVNSG
ncbi:hypothetical protein L7F22_007823 [Adiantum nelumboides]|nr:hypothetical protein [Adiantum nelumboides]